MTSICTGPESVSHESSYESVSGFFPNVRIRATFRDRIVLALRLGLGLGLPVLFSQIILRWFS